MGGFGLAARAIDRGGVALVRRVRGLNALLAARIWFLPAAIIAIYGIKLTDVASFEAILQDTLHNAIPVREQVLYSSPLNIFISALFHNAMPAKPAYLLTAGIGFAMAGILFRQELQRHPGIEAPAWIAVVFSSPLLVATSYFFGKGDPYLVAFYLLLLRNPVWWIELLLAAGIVLAHREIGTLVILVHGVVRRRLSWQLLSGVAVAHGLIYVYQHVAMDEAPKSRLYYTLQNFHELLHDNLARPMLRAVLSLGWFWVFAFRALTRSGAWRMVFGIAVAFGAGSFVEDFTRDIVLIALPVILEVAEWTASRPAAERSWMTSFPFPLAFLLQAYIVNGKEIRDIHWQP